MLMKKSTFTKKEPLYARGDFSVILNPQIDKFEEVDPEKESHFPNYLVVNNKTLAIEFASDQLAAAADVTYKLDESWGAHNAVKPEEEKAELKVLN